MNQKLRTALLAAGLIGLSTIVAADDISSLYGTWSLPGESCDEYNPSENIMVVSKNRIDFLEVGCDIQGTPGDLAVDTYSFDLECRGVESGPWNSVLVLQLQSGDMVLQAFEDNDGRTELLKRCPH